ncbi:MAG TPA: AI-2E family transporter [Steroidobacteraceae bacterium]|jgi:predicted PurR-regulated permease PerM|nr:AI-2E family transporter [Steroidobacteraceae bacterium]
MRPAIVPDSTDTLTQGDAVADESLTLPASRPAVEARGLALGVLASLAFILALWWARAFAIPLLLGVVLSYTLYPLVAWLEAIRVPRVVGTVIVMAGVLGGLAFGVYSLRGQMQTIIGQLPEAATKLSAGLAAMRVGPIGNMQIMQNAAAQMEKAATQAGSGPAAPRQAATHVIVDQPTFKLSTFLWRSSMDTIEALGQAAMVIFLVFFLLVGGDRFKRNLVRVTGPSLSRKKITLHILNDINHSIQKYLLMLLTTNLLVALLTWAVFRWLGLENAGAWAAAAGMLHIVPYLGPAVVALATAAAAYIQFDSPAMALLVAGASLAIATVIGTFVTTWMTGRIANMNSAAVFISLMFWGWLWGIWGMLLSVPILVIVKVVSQHVEQLHPMAELLGDS